MTNGTMIVKRTGKKHRSKKMNNNNATASCFFHIAPHCISCDTCTQIAPAHFVLSSSKQTAKVYQQPTAAPDTKRCMDACEACPVGAILYDKTSPSS